MEPIYVTADDAIKAPLTLSSPYDGRPTIVRDDDGPWLIVDHAYTRSSFVCDDDAWTIYDTNRDAAADAFGVAVLSPLSGMDVRGWRGLGHFLAVPIVDDETEMVDVLLDLTARLADYPLLDESTYSEREYEAWCNYWDDYGRSEVVNDAILKMADDFGVPVHALALQPVPESTIDRVAHDGMSHFYGFTGEYDYEGAVDAVVDLLAGLRPIFYRETAWS